MSVSPVFTAPLLSSSTTSKVFPSPLKLYCAYISVDAVVREAFAAVIKAARSAVDVPSASTYVPTEVILILSVPVAKSVIVSAVASVIPVSSLAKTKVSDLDPPVSVSAPPLPVIVSAPLSQTSMSAAAVPNMVAATFPSIVTFSKL